MHGKLSSEKRGDLNLRDSTLVSIKHATYSNFALSSTWRMLGLSRLSRVLSSQTKQPCSNHWFLYRAHPSIARSKWNHRFSSEQLFSLGKEHISFYFHSNSLNLSNETYFRAWKLKWTRIHFF